MTRIAAIAFAALSVSVAADFTYTEKTEMTGGSMKGMAERFGGQKGPQTTVHRVSGGRMATETGKQINIVDIDAETITMVDHDKKEYSVITFAEMMQAVEKMASAMEGLQGGGASKDAEFETKITVEDLPATRTVLGVTGKGSVMKMVTMAREKSSGQSVEMSSLAMEMYRGKLPGDATIEEYYKRAAAKTWLLNPAAMQAAMRMGKQASKGLGDMSKKMAEQTGTPLYSVTRMHTPMAGLFSGITRPNGDSLGKEIEKEAKQEAANQAGYEAGRALGGALGGRLGGLGSRIGRRAAQKAAEPPARQEPARKAEQKPAEAGSQLAMEMTTEVVSFSSDPVDQAVFRAPAGYKKVEHPMKRGMGQ